MALSQQERSYGKKFKIKHQVRLAEKNFYESALDIDLEKTYQYDPSGIL